MALRTTTPPTPRERTLRFRLLIASLLMMIAVTTIMVRIGAAESEMHGASLPFISSPAGLTTEAVGTGFAMVVSVTHAGDERLFVGQRAGEIDVLQSDGTKSLFLDISDRVHATDTESGFFDMAFHPGYAEPRSAGYGQFFVSYTGLIDGTVYTFVSRFTVTADPNQANRDSETQLLMIEQQRPVHKGGGLDFDKRTDDLYIGIGEDWQPPLSQDPTSLKGKILRLAVDDVPTDVVGDATSLITPEIVAMGLRNPWRLDVDETSNQIFVGEVGGEKYEEINLVPLDEPIRNYGWPCYEGFYPADEMASEPYCSDGRLFDPPAFAYAHAEGRCAVIGGVVLQSDAQPTRYLFGDMCSQEVLLLLHGDFGWQALPQGRLDKAEALFTFGQGNSADLYAGMGNTDGPIYRLQLP